jgi:hypothetical protein
VKELAIVAGVIALGLVVVGGVVFGTGDRQLFVPPPETVAESFTRELVQRRYELATKYLATEVRRNTPTQRLRARFEPLRQAVGVPNQVSAQLEWMTDSAAAARATVDGRSATAALGFRFVRERGLWVIGQPPEDVPIEIRRRAP